MVVVGAGPAGCHAARGLAARGLRVLLVDRCRFPRRKPCGGALSERAWSRLPDRLRTLALAEVRAAELRLGRERTVLLESSRAVGRLVHRPSFDLANLELAAGSAGVDTLLGWPVQEVVEHGDRVELRGPGRTLRTRAVVAADGAEGVVGRTVRRGDRRRRAVAVEAEVDLPGGARPLLFDFGAVTGGYGWLFAKGSRSSLGVCVVEGGARGLRRQLEEFSAVLGVGPPGRLRGAPVPLGGGRVRAASARMVAVGDAADTVDPLTGEGIGGALESAELAVAAVVRLLAEGSPLAGYEARLWRSVHRPLRIALAVAPGLYRRAEWTFSLLLADRAMAARFVSMLRGEASYLGLAAAALVRAPRRALAGGRPSRVEHRVP